MGQRLNGYRERQYRQALRLRTSPAFDARHR